MTEGGAAGICLMESCRVCNEREEPLEGPDDAKGDERLDEGAEGGRPLDADDTESAGLG